MHLIAHRRNTLELLEATPTTQGVEVDLRSQGDRLVIHHDPFEAGCDFETWIAAYRHGTLILNVKEEGLEARLIDAMRRRGLTDWFFLDQSFPFLVKWSRTGFRQSAVRVSEFETIDTALTLAGRIDWVWVDCFTRFPIDGEAAARLRSAGFRLCLVSPELQGRPADDEIPALRTLLAREGIEADAVCTKRPDLWS